MKTLFIICITAICGVAVRAQSNNTDAARWLAKADLAPPFVVPASRDAWEVKRQELRAELWKLLGRLPPRPATPKVETLSREDRGEYVVEKFQFDNEAGAMVPGYLLLPKNASAKSPAILYCHWHGGEYDIGKEELFQARHTPEAPGPAFAKRGYVVLAIDAYASVSAMAGVPAAGRKKATSARNRPPNSTSGSGARFGACCCAMT